MLNDRNDDNFRPTWYNFPPQSSMHNIPLHHGSSFSKIRCFPTNIHRTGSPNHHNAVEHCLSQQDGKYISSNDSKHGGSVSPYIIYSLYLSKRPKGSLFPNPFDGATLKSISSYEKSDPQKTVSTRLHASLLRSFWIDLPNLRDFPNVLVLLNAGYQQKHHKSRDRSNKVGPKTSCK